MIPYPPISLEHVKHNAMCCQGCPLYVSRSNVVFGEGNEEADLVLVGEGPGAEEDKTGRPFVGRAGKLLDEGLAFIGLSRNDVYICNIVKCRPPANRVPEEWEREACKIHLINQLYFIQPKVVVLLGNTAYKSITGMSAGITVARGNPITLGGDQRIYLPTFHPAYILRNQSKKNILFGDLDIAKSLCRE